MFNCRSQNILQLFVFVCALNCHLQSKSTKEVMTVCVCVCSLQLNEHKHITFRFEKS